ncbi:MAG: hypothetical protein AAF441_20750, partial [Pseudomonadota bacterium]
MKINSDYLKTLLVGALMVAGGGTTTVSGADEGPERVPGGESEMIDELSGLTTKLQDLRESHPRQMTHPLRGVHAKSHGCLAADFTVLKDLPERLRVGLFSSPGKSYKSMIRYSNAAVLVANDMEVGSEGKRENGSRGMAIKIRDVDGEVLVEDPAGRNQDFLMINTPEFAFANVRDYLRLNRILSLSKHGHDAGPYFIPLRLAQLGEPKDGEPPEKTTERKKLQAAMKAIPAFKDFGKQDGAGTLASFKSVGKIRLMPVRNPIEIAYFGAAPFAFGPDNVMKVSVAPCKGHVKQQPFENVTADDPKPDYLRDAITSVAGGTGEICLNFRINVRPVDVDDLKIEDATKVWPNEEKGYVNAARITIKLP